MPSYKLFAQNTYNGATAKFLDRGFRNIFYTSSLARNDAMYYASFQYHWTQLTSTSLEFISTGWQLVCRWLAVPCVMNQPVARFTCVLDDVWSIHPAVSRCTFRAAESLYRPEKKGAPRGIRLSLKISVLRICRRGIVDNRRNIPSLWARHRNHGRLRRATQRWLHLQHTRTYDYHYSKFMLPGCRRVSGYVY